MKSYRARGGDKPAEASARRSAPVEGAVFDEHQVYGNQAAAAALAERQGLEGAAWDEAFGEVARAESEEPEVDQAPELQEEEQPNGGIDASGVRVNVRRRAASGESMSGLFGYAHYRVERFYDPEDSKSSDGTLRLNGLVDVTITPKINTSTGRVNVASPDAAVINDEQLEVDGETKAAWEHARDDLTPGPGPMYRTPRDHFWSGELVKRHEEFHREDLASFAESEGTDAVRGALEAAGNGRAQGIAALGQADVLMKNAIDQYYAGQAIEPRRRQEMPAFEARAGEHRAYADGKDAYQQLADGIAKKGEELSKKK